jgi:hypothetical protein
VALLWIVARRQSLLEGVKITHFRAPWSHDEIEVNLHKMNSLGEALEMAGGVQAS